MGTAFAALVAFLALFVAVSAPYWHDHAMRRAFGQLQDDWEDFHDRINSLLGRVSRIKRDNIRLTKPPEVQSAEPDGAPGVEREAVLARRSLTRAQLLANYKRRHDPVQERDDGR